ncbi:MAG: hypothetical protein JOZ98_05835 [Solirubrobacterales bacterium]|nr:hypothetical protein [Solirubrobacterales bacterium]
MLSQPAPSGSHLTFGITGVGDAAAPSDCRAPLRAVGDRIACGPDNPAAGRGLAAVVWVDDAEDAVDGVVMGPLSSEQPLAHPVATGPTNVGECWPRLDVVTRLGPAPAALPLVAAPMAPSSATASVNCTIRPRMMLPPIPRICPPFERLDTPLDLARPSLFRSGPPCQYLPARPVYAYEHGVNHPAE